MKKFRKAIVALLAMVMVIGCLTVQASAAWDDGTVYIVGNRSVLSESGTSEWNASDAKAMTNNGDGTYTVSFTVTASTTYEFKFLESNDDGAWGTAWGNSVGGNFGYLALSDGTATVTLDTAGGNSAVSVTGLVSPNPAETYYVVGEINGWSFTADQMTDNGDGTFSKTFTDVDASFNFKVAQDAPTYGWYQAWGGAAAGQTGNDATATVTETSDVTITFNPTNNGTITIDVTPVQTPAPTTAAPTTAAPTTAAPTTGANNTTTAANNTTTAEPTSANNGGQGGDNVNDNTTGRTVAVVIAGVAVMLAATVAFVASKKRVTE